MAELTAQDSHSPSHGEKTLASGEHAQLHGGAPLASGPSVVDGRRYPRGGDYEAQYLDTKELPNFQALSRIGNPTALGIVSFCVPLTIASMALMRFGTLNLNATWGAVGPYMFIGGLGMLLAAIFEIIVGNSFAFVVFASFSGYWFSLSALFNSDIGVAATTSAQAAAVGAVASVQLNQSLGFWQITYVIIDTVFLICSLRTNLVFIIIFTALWPTFVCLAVMLTNSGLTADQVEHWSKAAGAFGFIASLTGWYLFLALMVGDSGHAFKIPVGDLSSYWSSKDDKRASKSRTD